MAARVPYTQQFSPKQTPLSKLLPVLRKNAGKSERLRRAIAGAFFKARKAPAKLAGNTMIALRTYGIIDKENLTDFGKELIAAQGDDDKAYELLARRILFDLNGIALVETMREMEGAHIEISLSTLPRELRHRGFEASDNSSDLSGVLGWLRKAGMLSGYSVNERRYHAIAGAAPETLDNLKSLNAEQVAFLRALTSINPPGWLSYNSVCRQAEQLYPGEIRFNWKEVMSTVLVPLKEAELIEVRKKAKVDRSAPAGRGGKPADIRSTEKFRKEIAGPLLDALYRSAGFAQVREIRSKSLASIVAEIEQKEDHNKRGKALEMLAIRLCQMLDLEFMGWRETDIEVTAGGEVDAMLHSARLIYSRWQVQCKVGPITLEAVAKEVGMCSVTLANVILLVSTGKATEGAKKYRRKILSSSNLNIIFVDGNDLRKIIKDGSALLDVLHQQAEDALKLKTPVSGLKSGGTGGTGRELAANSSGSEQSSKNKPLTRGPEHHEESTRPAYSTELGRMYCGDSLTVIPHLIQSGIRAKLIVTSPPFALVRKKEYGNQDSDSYVRWFERFIPHLTEILEPDGSLVIDIGGAWLKGIPAKSTYHFKLLLKLCESGFFLAQDFYHYNPARLPTPAEWVTVRRLRVKDSINNVWWLTRDPFTDSDNRRVLLPYSESMKGLLRNGYKPALRPSGHDISNKFQKDNGGAIPPNLLPFSNTESNSYYLRRCKEKGIKAHPARFPQALPEFFIKFLTGPGDLVIDPFAGSNVTGAAAEALGRQWITVEVDPKYVEGSRFRFERPRMTTSKQTEPCDNVKADNGILPLFA